VGAVLIAFAKGTDLRISPVPPILHVIISYSQSLSARRTVSTNVLFEPTTAFEPVKFA
jgi:hypothetical protein